MKVDGITLLQMIKDGKIKDKTEIRIYYHNVPTRNILVYSNGELGWKPGTFLVGDLCKDEHTFEIIEEDKEIEQLDPFSYDEFKCMTPKERFEATIEEYDKINELVIAVNKLKKESK